MTLKKYLWEKAKKGSFTIEAACVMSLILVAVMGILYLCFFVHNRAWQPPANPHLPEVWRETGKAETQEKQPGNAVRSWGILDFLGLKI